MLLDFFKDSNPIFLENAIVNLSHIHKKRKLPPCECLHTISLGVGSTSNLTNSKKINEGWLKIGLLRSCDITPVEPIMCKSVKLPQLSMMKFISNFFPNYHHHHHSITVNCWTQTSPIARHIDRYMKPMSYTKQTFIILILNRWNTNYLVCI